MRLDHLKQLLAGGTKPPWRAEGGCNIVTDRVNVCIMADGGTVTGESEANRAIIVALVNAGPAMVAVCEAAKEISEMNWDSLTASVYRPKLLACLDALEKKG